MLKFLEFFKGILLKGNTSNPSDNEEGSIWVNSTDNEIKAYLDSAIRTILTEDQVQDVSNKNIDADNNSINNLAHGSEVDDPVTGVHGVSGTIMGTTDTQGPISNKTLDNSNSATFQDDNFTLQDDGDNTKQAQFQLSGISPATTRTYSVPDADTTMLGNDAAQVVTNKDIDGGTASNTRRITIPQDTKANLDALTRKEGTIVYATDEDTIYVDDGTNLIGVGSGGGLVKADFLDPVSTTLPTGSSVTFDGVSGSNGDLILFSNLSSGNNKIYELSGVGVSIAFTEVIAFGSSDTPTDGDTVIIRQGDAFAEQIARFDGTNWKVNDIIRLFDGVSANFWELGSNKSATLADNSLTNVFSVNVTGSENFIVHYSLSRGTNKETGQLYITSDGSTVSLARSEANIGDSGVTFSAQINSGDLELDATTTSTGSAATMRYFVMRWSDSVTGGPTGVPNYSSTGSGTSAAGNISEVQFHGSGGLLDADSEFKWDTSNKELNLNELRESVLSSGITINDNQVSPANLFTFVAATYRFAVIEYSAERNGEYRTGRILVSNNGTTTGFSDDFVETAVLGVTFDSNISAGNVEIRYTSTSTGFTGTFKYTIRKWS